MGSGGVPKASGQRAQVWGESALETPLQMRRLAALSRRAIRLATDTNQAGLQTFKNQKLWWLWVRHQPAESEYDTDTYTSEERCTIRIRIQLLVVFYPRPDRGKS